MDEFLSLFLDDLKLHLGGLGVCKLQLLYGFFIVVSLDLLCADERLKLGLHLIDLLPREIVLVRHLLYLLVVKLSLAAILGNCLLVRMRCALHRGVPRFPRCSTTLLRVTR